MATLQLTNLKCYKKQDSIGKDEIYVKLNGQQFDCGAGLKKNTSRTLNTLIPPFQFTNQVKVELFERDRGSQDDFLGEAFINGTATGGELRSRFNNRAGADYELSYTVE